MSAVVVSIAVAVAGDVAVVIAVVVAVVIIRALAIAPAPAYPLAPASFFAKCCFVLLLKDYPSICTEKKRPKATSRAPKVRLVASAPRTDASPVVACGHNYLR